MAALEQQTIEGEPGDLKAWLSENNVDPSVYKFLVKDKMDFNELMTYDENDITQWCELHHIKIVQRKRLINLMKTIPRSEINNLTSNVNYKVIHKIIRISEKDEKQLLELKNMSQECANIIKYISEKSDNSLNNIKNATNEINKTCDQVQIIVENVRTTLLKNVETMGNKHIKKLKNDFEMFSNVLANIDQSKQLFDDYTQDKFDSNENDENDLKQTDGNYENNNNDKTSEIEINKKIEDCKLSVSNLLRNQDILSTINEIDFNFETNFTIKNIETNLTNSIKIKTHHKNDNFFVKIDTIQFEDNSFKLCKFSHQYTDLSQCPESILSNDKTHIKLGHKQAGDCPVFIKDKNVCIYNDPNNNSSIPSTNQYCWRMYYKTIMSDVYRWLFFGIYPFSVKPKNKVTYKHNNVCGIGGNEIRIYQNGKHKNDENMRFLYISKINEIDMLLDFNDGSLTYKVVDDNIKNREYKIIGLNKDICYVPHLQLAWRETEIQLAEIPVNMFGKNKNYVKWNVKYETSK